MAKNHIVIPTGASALGNLILQLVELIIHLVSVSHRARKVMDKVKLDNELAAALGNLSAEDAEKVLAVIRAFDTALSAAVVSDVTDTLG